MTLGAIEYLACVVGQRVMKAGDTIVGNVHRKTFFIAVSDDAAPRAA
jgi:hypothetical protein